MKSFIIFAMAASSHFAVANSLNYTPDFLKALSRGLSTQNVEVPQIEQSGFLAYQSFDENTTHVVFHPNLGLVTKATYQSEVFERIASDSLIDHLSGYFSMHRGEFGLENNQLVLAKAKRVDLTPFMSLVSVPVQLEGRNVHDGYVQISFTKNKDGSFRKNQIYNQSFAKYETETPFAMADLSDLKSATGMSNVTLLSIDREWTAKETEDKLIPTSRFLIKDANNVTYQVVLSDLDNSIVEAERRQYSNRAILDKLSPKVWQRSYQDNGLIPSILPFTPLVIDGQRLMTFGDGSAQFDDATSAQVILENGRTSIHDRSFNSPAYSYTVELNDKNPELDENDLRATNTYVAINDINLFVRSHIDPNETRYLNRKTQVRFNFSGDCNAYYNGQITLFSAGSGCANMAEVNDVIYHEWGHGLDAFTGRRPGIQDGAFSEGIGDIVAAYYTNSSNMGQGFFASRPNGIRQLDNDFKYPDDRGEVHDEGRIIGGAFWHLREAMMQRHGEKKGHYLASKYFLRHLLVADNYTESYGLVLQLDDDDGDANTRSPNHCLINKVFARHGLANDEGCNDVDFDPDMKVDSDIRFALIDDPDNEDQKILVASVSEKSELSFCQQVESCEQNAVEMVLDGVKDGRYLYRSIEAVELENHEVVRIENDRVGQERTARKFKVVYR